jgi:hypothetical protein
MKIERRALYNLMRMNWLLDSNTEAEPWQVDDYRNMPSELIFERLKAHDILLERSIFLKLSENFDTPEELTDDLLADTYGDSITQDQVYLLVFELWRRLLPETPSLSIFCDELDYQIYLYDSGKQENSEAIQDSIANLQVILDENADQGVDPVDVFESVCSGCANDLESFLYDYISDQIENGNLAYASELLDGFNDYVKDLRWFDFLKVRLMSQTDPQSANELIKQLINEVAEKPDIEFNLELLSFFIQAGEREIFVDLVKKTLPLIKFEEDFQDLLSICIDYYRRLDRDLEEQQLQKLLRKRSYIHLEGTVDQKDSHLFELIKIIG